MGLDPTHKIRTAQTFSRVCPQRSTGFRFALEGRFAHSQGGGAPCPARVCGDGPMAQRLRGAPSRCKWFACSLL